MTIPARLSVVTLGARDLPALRAFYRRLGWPEVPGGGDGWAGFLLGGVLLALYPADALAAEAGAPPAASGRTPAAGPGRPSTDPGTPPAAQLGAPSAGGGGGWSGVTLACNVDSAGEVDAAYAAALAAGARPIAAPVTRDWGGRSGYVADPEGNRWEIAWAGSARFDARGALISFG